MQITSEKLHAIETSIIRMLEKHDTTLMQCFVILQSLTASLTKVIAKQNADRIDEVNIKLYTVLNDLTLKYMLEILGEPKIKKQKDRLNLDLVIETINGYKN